MPVANENVRQSRRYLVLVGSAIGAAAERRRNEPGELFCLLSFVQSVLYGSYEIYTYSMTNNDRILMCI